LQPYSLFPLDEYFHGPSRLVMMTGESQSPVQARLPMRLQFPPVPVGQTA